MYQAADASNANIHAQRESDERRQLNDKDRLFAFTVACFYQRWLAVAAISSTAGEKKENRSFKAFPPSEE